MYFLASARLILVDGILGWRSWTLTLPLFALTLHHDHLHEAGIKMPSKICDLPSIDLRDRTH